MQGTTALMFQKFVVKGRKATWHGVGWKNCIEMQSYRMEKYRDAAIFHCIKTMYSEANSKL